ncbi:MAG TPA: hypothetical protein VJ819_12995 [Nocardioidaceae bacterium]|nr:hypothetical protein [Nocardioidaceae bacterium]
MHRYPWLLAATVLALALSGALWWVGSADRSAGSSGSSLGPALDRSDGSGFGWSTSAGPAGPVGLQDEETPAASRSMPAVDVLHDWDRARARAYAAGDADGLRALYTPGSSAGTADVAILASYTRRGLRVEGMRMQLLALEVLGHRPGRWRLRVTDRLHGAVAVDASGVRLRLPRDQASIRVISLRRTRGGWRVAAVTHPVVSR